MVPVQQQSLKLSFNLEKDVKSIETYLHFLSSFPRLLSFLPSFCLSFFFYSSTYSFLSALQSSSCQFLVVFLSSPFVLPSFLLPLCHNYIAVILFFFSAFLSSVLSFFFLSLFSPSFCPAFLSVLRLSFRPSYLLSYLVMLIVCFLSFSLLALPSFQLIFLQITSLKASCCRNICHKFNVLDFKFFLSVNSE